ncbi:DUF1194 domain-containing protein [Rubellimicrobium arenae]|uniref:DUF1194 domain-containing protein n=1 Tax=Rubellimicrobium arenae TaxID=2817372 RepID=UPI001B314B67|nr:DUF1194 domain-containing protein [Rubellimicrobium arenae]
MRPCPPVLARTVRGAALLLGLAAGGAAAQDCRLALVLALDVSSSVDAAEDRLQREGTGRALVAPDVVRAFLLGDPVALYAFEWSGRRAQVPLLPGWVLVRSEDDLRRVASAIAKARRSHNELPTALGAALGFAATRLGDAPDCRARTIDVSGDGMNNESFGPRIAYETFPFDGVTVNALVIGGSRSAAELVAWFQDEVLRGPGAFSIFADGYQSYEDAMRAKLLRELEIPAVSSLPGGRSDAG